MSNDKKYNGWSNYETWLVNLWIDNEQGTQEYWHETAQELFEAATADGSFTKSERACLDLSDHLKGKYENHVAEQLPDAGFLRDLANTALSEVNWMEISDALLYSAVLADATTKDVYENIQTRSSYA